MIGPASLQVLPLLLALALLAASAAGCSEAGPRPAAAGSAPAAAWIGRAIPADPEGDLCRARAREIRRAPDLGGAPAFDRARVELLGRARGEPLVLVREPAAPAQGALPPALAASRRTFEEGRPGARVVQLRGRHRNDPAALRAVLLREGYLYSAEPLDALAMVTALELSDLFDEPEIWLARGQDRHRLRRVVERREVSYRHAGGPLDGRREGLLFGDRVAASPHALDAPLHRDLRALAADLSFDRARVLHRTDAALVAELRAGGAWIEAVLDADGAALRLGCLAGDRAAREAFAAARQVGEAPRRALARVRAVVTEEVQEALRFDRPEGEETADRDGLLRPQWASAYRQGRAGFEVEGVNYAVFDAAGKPWPPQVCVDFVLDTFERASGTWFAPKGAPAARLRGGLDFDDTGIPNRRGVLPFGDFAETRPDLFEVRRFRGEERVPFGERSRFFRFLEAEADAVRPGDVIAIHGLKRDDRIHQHAILVEWSDPLTGFPAGLADQMKRPRRRTWEGIMAEAPKRSLYYRVRPTPALLAQIAAGG